MINEIIKNGNLTNEPVVLNPVWTENKDFSCSLMGDVMMMTDMVECQDLIAALSIAETRGVEIPKLKASQDPDAPKFNGWHAVNVDIMSPVSNDFMQILIDVQSGELGLKDRINNMLHDNFNMAAYTLQLDDNIAVINATLNI